MKEVTEVLAQQWGMQPKAEGAKILQKTDFKDLKNTDTLLVSRQTFLN